MKYNISFANSLDNRYANRFFGGEELKRKSTPVDKLEALNSETDLEFIPDSPEQIRNSIRYIGYRDKLNGAFKAAIARVKKTTQ